MKSTRFYFVRASLILSAILFVFAFAGCEVDTKYEFYDLEGTWKSSYGETFTIDFSNDTFDAGSYSYAGKNVVVKFTDNDSGYIYIKYTRAYEYSTTEPTTDADSWTVSEYNGTKSWYRYSATAPDVGKWYAISYKNLTDSSIQLSGAYKDGGKTSTDTLEEAIKEFTIGNGYFSSYSDCVK